MDVARPKMMRTAPWAVSYVDGGLVGVGVAVDDRFLFAPGV